VPSQGIKRQRNLASQGEAAKSKSRESTVLPGSLGRMDCDGNVQKGESEFLPGREGGGRATSRTRVSNLQMERKKIQAREEREILFCKTARKEERTLFLILKEGHTGSCSRSSREAIGQGAKAEGPRTFKSWGKGEVGKPKGGGKKSETEGLQIERSKTFSCGPRLRMRSDLGVGKKKEQSGNQSWTRKRNVSKPTMPSDSALTRGSLVGGKKFSSDEVKKKNVEGKKGFGPFLFCYDLP